MTIREEISAYLLKNQIDRSQKNPYDAVAKHFGVSTETIRQEWRKLRNKRLVEAGEAKLFVQYSRPPGFEEDSFKRQGDTATLSKTLNKEIKNEKDLAKDCNIDLATWEITKWECKRYNAWIKNKAGEIESQPKYSVYAQMKLRSIDTDLGLQKELIIKELRAHSPKVSSDFKKTRKKEGTLLELSLPDLHIGKLGWIHESGENYDIKIAVKRYREAIAELLSRVNLDRVERFHLPLGNDALHVDNAENTTTAGTVVDTEGRFPKIVQAAKLLFIETVDYLKTIAPVDITIVRGNHDSITMFMLGEVLEAWYHNDASVKVNNAPKFRKYYQYGKCGFLYSHGDKEKHSELGLIFATEEPDLWAKTRYRFCKLGHKHITKKTNYVAVDSFPGFQIEILPSLSGTDEWHYAHGYLSNKQAKAFEYDREEGEIAEYTYSV